MKTFLFPYLVILKTVVGLVTDCSMYVPKDYSKSLPPNGANLTVINFQYEIINFDSINVQENVRI